MSSAQEKLVEFARAWKDADDNYSADVAKAAGKPDLIHQIEVNWWGHQANWAMAATAALEKTSPDIEKLTADAKKLSDDIVAAREAADKIVDIVKGSSKVAKALASLLKAVA